MRWALALVPKGPWTWIWLDHVGFRWVCSQRPSAAGFLLNTPMRWALALVPKGPWTCVWLRRVGFSSVVSQRPSAAGFLFQHPPILRALALVPKRPWACICLHHVVCALAPPIPPMRNKQKQGKVRLVQGQRLIPLGVLKTT